MINALIVLGCVVAGTVILLGALFMLAFIIISRSESNE